MQELINKLTSEVGLSADQATKALNTVMDFVKTKIPPAFATNIEAIFTGSKIEATTDSITDKASDLAGDVKDKAINFAEDAKDKLEDFAEEAKDKLGDAADKAEEMAKDAFGKLKGMFGGDNK